MSHHFLYSLVRCFLFSLDPERAHRLALESLQRAAAFGLLKNIDRSLAAPRRVMGIMFPNPVGLAAGLDKNGAYIDGLAALGFGFLEIGTVTPRAQPGNPKPRVFRLPKAHAIINRLGFNNDGVDTFIRNIQASAFFQNKIGVLGINIGKNFDTPIERAVEDYVYCYDKVYPYASYVTINISSPNTKNLRQLQETAELDRLLGDLKRAQQRLTDKHQCYVPLVLKIAPDITKDQVKSMAQALLRHGIDGVIATNTTMMRPGIAGLAHSNETGGLSGGPLTEISTQVLSALKAELGEAIPIIGVGGILSGADARRKIDAGATLVQLYTGFIYRGPALISECVQALQ